MRRRHAPLAVCWIAIGLALGGCEYLDGMFENKKPLPGERRPVFPQGVPGVPQGVPPELVQGYVPPPEPEPPKPAVAEKPKPRPRPQPRQVAAPARPAGNVAIQPTSQGSSPFPPPPSGQRAASPFPDPPPSNQPARAPSASPFPDPPPPPPR
jgi:hypothetical protein